MRLSAVISGLVVAHTALAGWYIPEADEKFLWIDAPNNEQFALEMGKCPYKANGVQDGELFEGGAAETRYTNVPAPFECYWVDYPPNNFWTGAYWYYRVSRTKWMRYNQKGFDRNARDRDADCMPECMHICASWKNQGSAKVSAIFVKDGVEVTW